MDSTATQRLTFDEYPAYNDNAGSHNKLVDASLVLMNPPRIE
jgi:hypothetical protein